MAEIMKRNAWQRKYKQGREEAGMCSLTLTDLEQMYIKQRGRCYYSGLPMTFTSGMWKASPERLDNNKGYVEGNVVLVCLEFNGVHQMNADRVEKLVKDGQKVEERKIKKCDLIDFWRKFKIQNQQRTPPRKRLVNQFLAQNGRCFCSNIPLQITDTDTQHYRPAIVYNHQNKDFYLIIQALKISQYCQWTREKFDTLRHHYLIRAKKYTPGKPIRRRFTRLLHDSDEKENE